MEWSIHEASVYISLNGGITRYLVHPGVMSIRRPVHSYVLLNTEYPLVLILS